MSNPNGRPSRFKQEYCEQARKLCLLGHIDSELAEFFGVSLRGFAKWKTRYPEFMAALTAGKVIADANVSQSLYNMAIGYKVQETMLHVVDKVVVPTQVERQVAPSATACIFWLKNRQIGKWRDRVDQDIKITSRTLAEELAELNAKRSPDSG